MEGGKQGRWSGCSNKDTPSKGTNPHHQHRTLPLCHLHKGRGSQGKDLQRSQHIPRRNGINSNPRMSPLDSKRSAQMSDRRFSRIIRRLRLRHIHNRPAHTADEDHTARALTLEEVARDARGEEVRAVDVDAPELLHPVVGVRDGVEVLGEAGRGDEVVELAVRGDALVDAGRDGVRVRHVAVVGGDFGDVIGAGIFGPEGVHEVLGLFLGFFFYK